MDYIPNNEDRIASRIFDLFISDKYISRTMLQVVELKTCSCSYSASAVVWFGLN